MKLNFLKRFSPRRPKQVLATCDRCGGSFDIEKHIEDRPDALPGVTQVGLLCPHCGAFALSYRSTKQLDQLRKRVQEAGAAVGTLKTTAAIERYGRLRRELAAAHEALNPPKAGAEATKSPAC